MSDHKIEFIEVEEGDDLEEEGMGLEDVWRGMPPLALARAFWRKTGGKGMSKPEIEEIVLQAAGWLEGNGTPRQWEALDAEGFFNSMASLERRQLEAAGFALMALFTWMSIWQIMEPEAALVLVRHVQEAAPYHPVLASYAHDLEGTLCKMMVSEGGSYN